MLRKLISGELMVSDYLNSIDWSSVDWSLVLSILALVSTLIYNFIAHRSSQKTLKLELQKYKEEQEEKARRTLKIVVSHSSKYEEPLKWVGLWLIVSNQGFEQPLLGEVPITLTFGNTKSETRGCLLSFIRMLSHITDDIEFTFGLYSGVSSAGGVNDFRYSDRITRNFYLINWDTKKRIFFAPQNEYRMPAPGEKERWYFFANLPEEETREWTEKGYYLSKVELNFITDQGEFEVSENITATLIDDKLLQERTKYTFDFEPNHMSSFMRRFK